MHYLDWASTAIPGIHVSEYNYNWFNPNSHYAIDECLEFVECEKQVKKTLGAKSGKVIFGGNASWFFDKLSEFSPDALFCSPYEHKCVYDNGLEMGNIDKLQEYDIYCHQFVNNVTGEIFPVDKIGRTVREKQGFFICDATAAIGRCIVPDELDNWCDMFVMSSHKAGVDNKQIGCAWISDRFFSYLADLGNSFMYQNTVMQSYGWINGTPDLACVKATTEAIIFANKRTKGISEHYENLIWALIGKLEANDIDYIGVHAKHTKQRCLGINAITLPNIKADALCNYLASVHQVYISPGHSACEENSDYRVLKRYGLSQEECESTIRVSFGPSTSYEDINAFVGAIIEYKERYMND